jgi:dihydroorotate dehydrogenase (NAD+) catalytic subunit
MMSTLQPHGRPVENSSQEPDWTVQLGRLRLPNPILVASGTFGYAREMAGLVDLNRLGGLVPKTVTMNPRAGNAPRRTIETAGGMLNSIGLDNDGIDAFIDHHLPYLTSLGPPVIVSVAGKSADDWQALGQKLADVQGIGAVELNLSCPNVAGGVDFATDPRACEAVVRSIREVCSHPLLAKLTPNVTDVRPIAEAALRGGADGLVLINTCLGMAVDWRRRKPLLGNVVGGLSGPAIKPIALRIVHQVTQAFGAPIIAAGGIHTIDDAMEFFVTGASAVQIGTANFYDPTSTMRLLDELKEAFAVAGVKSVAELRGSLKL